MQFVIHAYDGTDDQAPVRRQNSRPAHLENIKKVKETGSVLCAGGIIEDGRAIGSFLIMEFATQVLFDDYLANEPYVINKVWQDIKVETVNVVIMNDEKVGK